jgi:predicted patatin/cPLA2 family phospholipase
MSHPVPPYYGTRPDAAVASINARAAAWRAGPQAADGRKLGLVVEGGAKRGILSGGGMVALSHLGFHDLFDEVFATSAGVMNASYFLSQQTAAGITIYYEDLADKRFWNPRRFWKPLDVDYIFRDVVVKQKPLDTEAILRSRSRLLVAAIDVRSAEGVLIDTKDTKTPLLQVLKAASAIPVLYNRTVDVDGAPLVDGGLAIPFPLQHAIDRGCTDILVMLTRPPAYRTPTPGRSKQFVFRRFIRGDRRKMAALYAAHALTCHAARDLALGVTPPGRPVNIVTICPEPPELIHRTSLDPTLLRQGALDYGRKVLRAFGAGDHGWALAPT